MYFLLPFELRGKLELRDPSDPLQTHHQVTARSVEKPLQVGELRQIENPG